MKTPYQCFLAAHGGTHPDDAIYSVWLNGKREEFFAVPKYAIANYCTCGRTDCVEARRASRDDFHAWLNTRTGREKENPCEDSHKVVR